MQKIFTFLLLLCCVGVASAQITITIGGTVTDTNGDPVENVSIFVSTDSIGTSMYTNTLVTDANGDYGDSFTVDNNFTQGIVYFTMENCNGYYVNETAYWNPGNTDLVVDFTYCDLQFTCTADILYDESTAELSVLATGEAPYTYLWSNGATTPTIFATPANSTYCVTITDANGCSADACEFVNVVIDTSCYVSISQDPQNPAGWTLTANGTGTPPFVYEWNTGATTQDIIADGTGLYCVTLTDANACTVTTCVLVNTEGCTAIIQQTAFGELVVAISGNAPFTYEWSTGETTAAITPTTSDWYCVTVTDTNGCESDDCIYVYGGIDSTCYVNIIEVQNGAWLQADADGADPFTYEWNTGETTASVEITASGPYCVTVTDVNGCTSTDCHYAMIADQYQIRGDVFLVDSLNQPALIGWAYLIVYDETAGTLTAIDTVELENYPQGWTAYYDFGDVAAGDYLVKVALAPNSPEYENTLPTYVGDVLWWDEATTIVKPSTWYGGYKITMVEGDNPGGPGFIGGLVSEGANLKPGEAEERGPGDPVEGVSIIVLDEMEEPVAYTYTDSEGRYEFPSLAWGTYKVVIEIVGHEQEYYWVTLSPENPSVDGLNFEVDEEGITVLDATIVETAEQIQLFPNPATDVVHLQIDAINTAKVQMTVTDFTGRILEAKTLDIQMGLQQFDVNVSQYPAGFYLINLQNGQKTIGKKFVK